MTIKEKFEEVSGFTFTDSIGQSEDIEIGTWSTADGYEIWVITDEPRRLSWDTDVFYYQPDFDTIMEWLNSYGGPATVHVYDFDELFDEYYLLEYLKDNMDEDEFEKFTNENE